jgi:hypothetical protein
MNFDTFSASGTGMPDYKIFHQEGIKNFGYISKVLRTKEQENINEDLINQMPSFKIFNSGTVTRGDVKKVCHWDFHRAANNGKDFKRFYQKLGSCVGNGFGQVLWGLQAIEAVKLGEPETPTLPFWLLGYGRSRFYGGLKGKGEGSFGSAMAEAAKKDGSFDAFQKGVPQPIFDDSGGYNDGVTWGEKAELDWSDGAKIDQKWLDLSRQHLIKTVSLCKNSEEAREAIINGYPLTIASNWGGDMRPSAQGKSEPILLNRRTDVWQHQMSVHGWWEHPDFGEVFYVFNSWGTNAHGKCPSGAPLGGFWILKKDMDYICKQKEAFAFSQYDGFPAQPLEDYLFDIFRKN